MSTFPPIKKNVLEDMLKNLEAKAPNFGSVIDPAPGALKADSASPETPEERIVALEEKSAQLTSMLENALKEITKTIQSNARPAPINAEVSDLVIVGEQEPMVKAEAALQGIVARFNADLNSWYEKTGCVANFGWTYAPNKNIEVSGIDVIVYRKAPPSETTMKEVLAKDPSI